MDNGNTQNFELDQLNLDTTSENWDDNAPEHDQRALGNTAINPIEITPGSITNTDPDTSPQPTHTPEAPMRPTTPELGQITPSMPPGYAVSETDLKLISQSQPQTFSFQPHHAMSGDHLSPQALATLQDREKELSADGNIAAFVDFIDDARDQFQNKEAA